MWAGGLTSHDAHGAATAGTLAVLLIGGHPAAWGAGIGLAAAAWTALCPWHIVFSRWALQSAFRAGADGSGAGGLWGVERQRRWGWPLAGRRLAGCSTFTPGAQPLVLAWSACLLWIYRRELTRRRRRRDRRRTVPGAGHPDARRDAGPRRRAAARERVAVEPAGRNSVLHRVAFIKNYFVHLNPVFLFWLGDINRATGSPAPASLCRWTWSCCRSTGLVDSNEAAAGVGARRGVAVRAAPAAITIGPNRTRCARSGGACVDGVGWGGLWLAADWMRRRDPRRRLDLLVWAAALAVSLSLFARYWRAYDSDPRVRVAFEQGESIAWNQIAREHRPGQRVYIAIQIVYVQYFELFHLRIPPREAARQGLGRGGDFIYFDMQRDHPEGTMRHGDWIVVPIAPWRVTMTTGELLLTPKESAQIADIWVLARQK